MNILLLTYSFNYNYGGLLQAYATVKHLQGLGHSVTVPTSHPAHMVGNTSLLRGMGLSDGKPIAAVIRRLRQMKRYRRFDRFRRGLPMDHSLSSPQKINSSIGRFDTVLTGSDQTWNTKFMPAYDPYYYQGFISGGVRKVSYASCFGTREQKEALLSRAASDIMKFDAIAVRNDVSREIVERITGVTPQVVVDPTLLYDFNEFRSARGPNLRAPYVMVYALDKANFPVAESIVEQLRKIQPGIEVHFVNGEKNFEKPAWASHLINSYGPVEFLECIQDATYVVTDSFHGTIFAQKFDRPCIAYSSGWRAERIVSMMKDFDASDLLVLDPQPASVQRVVSKVSNEGARLRISDGLRQKIEASKTYLSEALASA
ncbi:hypothetical protein M2410_001125 [Stenotrophomonas chelatiphaga]|uniref:polysaccharide pyruvyl transferase family protein n=1 Tax=Stenotrophomonas chelatiphaga TaxID=517011 RepID=UPI00160FEBAB|nr:polysaccharide pyruvyl transferase family protein [Stenotrophomonas chelatiphaga]MCS4230401.1 hypothetical protein [Stenotrophomonas chelatiphaga]